MNSELFNAIHRQSYRDGFGDIDMESALSDSAFDALMAFSQNKHSVAIISNPTGASSVFCEMLRGKNEAK